MLYSAAAAGQMQINSRPQKSRPKKLSLPGRICGWTKPTKRNVSSIKINYQRSGKQRGAARPIVSCAELKS